MRNPVYDCLSSAFLRQSLAPYHCAPTWPLTYYCFGRFRNTARLEEFGFGNSIIVSVSVDSSVMPRSRKMPLQTD
jgi:hypothetical protein